MAFGALLGSGKLSGGSVGATNAITITGSPTVAVGDLIACVFAQQTNFTATTCIDNLGNTYVRIGDTDAGNMSGCLFYARVTVGGTLTTVTVAATASSNDFGTVAAAWTGPFTVSPLDKNPTPVSNDTTTPYTCPASTVLSQADELVVSWVAMNAGTSSWTATSPNIKVDETTAADNQGSRLGYQVVAATTSVSPAWTGGAPGSDVLGTATFKKETADTTTVDKADISVAGKTVNEIYPNITAATISLSGSAVNEIYPNITAASITLTGQAIADRDVVLVSQGTITLTGGAIADAETVSSATITLTGQSILAKDTELVSQATITLTGGAVNEVYPQVDAASITLAGQDVTSADTGAADTTTVDPASITLSGQSILANDTELVGSASITLAGQSVAANDTELVGQATITLTGGVVNEIYPNVSPASITLTGGAIPVNDTELVSQSTITLTGGLIIESDIVLVNKADITLTGSDIGLIDTSGDTTIVSAASIILTGGVLLVNDNEPLDAGLISLTGGDITTADTAGGDVVIVDPAQIILSPGGPCYLLLEDGSYLLLEDGGRIKLELDRCGDNVTVIDTIAEGGGGGTCRHPRWPLYVNWHLKNCRWERVWDCPPDVAEEIDRELPYEAPLAPEEIRRLVGTLSTIEDNDTEMVAILAALED